MGEDQSAVGQVGGRASLSAMPVQRGNYGIPPRQPMQQPAQTFTDIAPPRPAQPITQPVQAPTPPQPVMQPQPTFAQPVAPPQPVQQPIQQPTASPKAGTYPAATANIGSGAAHFSDANGSAANPQPAR